MNMSGPTVTVVKDGDGNNHWFSSDSRMLHDGLKDGTYVLVEEAKPDEATIPRTGDSEDSGPADDGSGHGKPAAGDDDRGGEPGSNQSKSRRERR